jgi:Alpha-2-macroglobulin family
VITGFSIDPITGLGLTKQPRTLNVFQPFFVSLNLPYSVKRGEVVSIPIVVFNYQDKDTNAEVTLHNTDQEFEFTEISNEIEENKSEFFGLSLKYLTDFGIFFRRNRAIPQKDAHRKGQQWGDHFVHDQA